MPCTMIHLVEQLNRDSKRSISVLTREGRGCRMLPGAQGFSAGKWVARAESAAVEDVQGKLLDNIEKHPV